MLREKYNSLTNKRGYLYIRETIYQRDKRTLKRKPAKLGDGSAIKNRWKYSKKIDIYCGKIITDKKLQKVITFEDYLKNIKYKNYINNNEDKKYELIKKIKNKDFDYLIYKTKEDFDKILDDFVDYILYSYEIDKKEFLEGKKIVYEINGGFFSRETIEWIRRFRINKSPDNPKEFERFTNRCLDSGIFDEEIINSLYIKLIPETANNIQLLKEKNEDEENKNEQKLKQIKINKLRDFMKNSIED